MFGAPRAGDVDYTKVVTLDLGTVAPSLAGPKRPQDRIELGNVKGKFTSLFSEPPTANGFNLPAEMLHTRHVVSAKDVPSGATPPDQPNNAPGAPRQVVEMSANHPTLEAAQSEA